MEIDNFDIKDADMVRDIKRAFASEHKLCPDVEDELSLSGSASMRRSSSISASSSALFTSIAVAQPYWLVFLFSNLRKKFIRFQHPNHSLLLFQTISLR